MYVIPNELVEETWQEVGSGSAEQARELINRIGKCQSNLLSFVIVFTEDLGVDAHELSLYLFTVIYRVFEKAAFGRIRQLKQREIEAAYEGNEKFCERYLAAHERFLAKAAESIAMPQPFVMKYLIEALFEAPEQEEDPVVLSEEDSGQIFLVLKTAIDLLADATSPAARK